MQAGLTMFCWWNGWFIVATQDGTPSDVADAFNASHWLQVLASRTLYGHLRRTPDREHLLRVLDVYVAYAARGQRYSRPARGGPRAVLALKLRRLVEAWTPPDLPTPIVDAARELLDAEGIEPPAGGWDAFVNRSEEPLEAVLLWPDGIPVVRLRARRR